MKNVLLGVIIAALVFIGFQYFTNKTQQQQQLIESSMLIEKELRNVGKLVVTEGTYSQIYSYKDTKSLLMGLVDSQKKALIIVNAEASISYDLSKIKTEIVKDQKMVRITEIPEPELKINPNIEYYDVSQQYLNQFNAEDYNIIKKRVTSLLRKKIAASSLRTNAQNRLITELQKMYILTNSLGWTLQYLERPIVQEKDLEVLAL